GAHMGVWRVALVAFAAIDIIEWSILRDQDRFALKSRLALDSFDVAFWSLAPYPHHSSYSYAAVISIPVALEAGMRRGAAGLVVPIVIMAATLTTRGFAGRALYPSLFVFPFFAVGWGVLLSRYIGRLQRRSEDEWSQRNAADVHRAFLAG